ncbi:MAG: LCP family protein, partial [Oscillospiraceae bacterium]
KVPLKASGLQKLNGSQAVAYARIRHVGNGDFERTDRQRKVMQELFNKALAMNPVKYPEFIRKMLPLVETSLDWGEIVSQAGIMLRDVKFEEARFPMNDDLIGSGFTTAHGGSCVYADNEKISKKLNEFIYDDIKPQAPTKK